MIIFFAVLRCVFHFCICFFPDCHAIISAATKATQRFKQDVYNIYVWEILQKREIKGNGICYAWASRDCNSDYYVTGSILRTLTVLQNASENRTAKRTIINLIIWIVCQTQIGIVDFSVSGTDGISNRQSSEANPLSTIKTLYLNFLSPSRASFVSLFFTSPSTLIFQN